MDNNCFDRAERGIYEDAAGMNIEMFLVKECYGYCL